MKHVTASWLATGLALALVLGSAAAAENSTDPYAGWLQPGPPPVQRFVKPLGLSPEQQAKLAPILEEARARAAEDARAAKSPDASPPDEEVGGRLAQRDADLRLRLADVLSPEQLARYEQLAAARAASRRTTNPHPAHGHSGMHQGDPAMERPTAPPPPAKR